MTENRIWAPWRLNYVKDADKDNEDQCVFCAKPALGDDETALIVHRGEHSFVILNLYPYTNGHLMVSPYEHVGRIQDIPDETTTEMLSLAKLAMNRLEDVYGPHGFNVGFNQGRSAGARVEHHLHMQVVPRRGGDTNIMTVISNHRVMPQSLEDSYRVLRGAFGQDAAPDDAEASSGQ